IKIKNRGASAHVGILSESEESVFRLSASLRRGWLRLDRPKVEKSTFGPKTAKIFSSAAGGARRRRDAAEETTLKRCEKASAGRRLRPACLTAEKQKLSF
ncbi:MAG: hypothetical protein K2K83_03995, partial [Rikenella sp.]|nr:hypothetical protein [Rikenella sp.]